MILATEEDARRWVSSRPLPSGALEQLEALAPLLAVENQRQNLVAATSLDQFWLRHIADSLQLLWVSRETLPAGSWLDLGTGAGFPGLVVAIASPERQVTLVESRATRAAWLRHAAVELDLRNVVVVHQRLELVETIEAACISARAFAPLERLLRLAARFSTHDTIWLLPKGRNARQELLEMPNRIQTMFHVEQSITSADAGILVGRGCPVIEKGRKR